ncbi:HIT family protein [Micromonospora sp. NBC_01813]|uniref:HIT family protein n=1 Tax=Micromonospora sp. NBC_01813 TaxID=2975988 RepID=UPI002DDAE1D5|nr:HIT family protein [Micromonospora sp. NBC_01813]WSA09476.1 HIT family protein [Micromonospora sp. NBC_01813]
MSDIVGCLGCDLTAGRRPLPGGRIQQTRHWVVEHCVGPFGVGTLIVKPTRHVVHLAELTGEESAEMGPLLQLTASAVTALTSPEQVYVCLWSHAGGVPGHIHFVVQPVRRDDSAGHDQFGPALQVAMLRTADLPDADAVVAFSDRMREHLAGTIGVGE